MLITPTLHFNGDCEEAVRLYWHALKLEVTSILRYRDANPSDMDPSSLPEDRRNWIYHGEGRIGEQRITFSDEPGEFPSGAAHVFLIVTFDEPDEVRAAYIHLVDGGTDIYPPQSTSYSSCFCSLIDRFGVRWTLMTEVAP